MAGVIVGLDWRAVDVLMPAGCDRAAVISLLRSFESGMISGVAEKGQK